MIEEEVEIPKTHSIVATAFALRANHIGKPVSYKGVEGNLIRYIPAEGALLELTAEETWECLAQSMEQNDP
jgi:hypothetical protein